MVKDPFETTYTDAPWIDDSKMYLSKERKLYRAITDHILNFEPKLFIDGKIYRKKFVRNIVFDVLNTNPLTFGLEKFKIVYQGRNTVILFYYYNEEKYSDWCDRIRDRVNCLYGEMGIDKCKTDLEKELAVNDWLCKNCHYKKDMDFHTKHSVLGILLEGNGVCSSFALTTSLLLMCFGVKCYSVDGDPRDPHYKDNYPGISVSELIDNMMIGNEGDTKMYTDEPSKEYQYDDDIDYDDCSPKKQGHAWNYVFIEGRGRHLDTTFNNGNHKNSSGKTKHSFFNLTNREIKEDRTISFGPCSDRRKK